MWRIFGELLLHANSQTLSNIGNLRRRPLVHNCRFGAKLLMNY